MSKTRDNANSPHQKGAPQDTDEMPSSGNSPERTGATSGTDENSRGFSDVERSGTEGMGTRRAPDSENLRKGESVEDLEGNQ